MKKLLPLLLLLCPTADADEFRAKQWGGSRDALEQIRQHTLGSDEGAAAAGYLDQILNVTPDVRVDVKCLRKYLDARRAWKRLAPRAIANEKLRDLAAPGGPLR